jgi:hypothetical protein
VAQGIVGPALSALLLGSDVAEGRVEVEDEDVGAIDANVNA